MRKAAVKRGFVSKPSADRYNQNAIAMGGGIAIFGTLAFFLLAAIGVVKFVIAPGCLNVFDNSVLVHVEGFLSKAGDLLVIVGCLFALFVLGLYDDRKGLGSTGPVILLPGQIQSLDLALPWARDFSGTAWSSAELLKERAAYIKDKFQNDPDFFSRIEQKQFKNQNVLVYPNPVKNELKVLLPETGKCKNLAVYSA